MTTPTSTSPNLAALPPAGNPAWEALEGVLRQSAVRIEDPAAVRDYLARYPELFPAVGAIGQSARAEFGMPARLRLRLYRDPEIEDRYLALYVRLPTYGPDVLSRLRGVAALHESALEQSAGTLLVTTDFGSVDDDHTTL
jgi:hypothetical protein